MSLGPTELLVIFAVIFLLFGGSRLGALGKGLGEGIANFKKGLASDGEDGKKSPKQLTGKPESTAVDENAPAEKKGE